MQSVIARTKSEAIPLMNERDCFAPLAMTGVSINMKKLLLSIIILCTSLFTFSQPYGNEWIDYSKSYYKVRIWKAGIYRISYQALDAAIPLATVKGDNFQLFHMGQEIPIYVTTGNTLGSTDYIEFYGKKNDGTFDLELFNGNADWQANPSRSFFSDTAAYFLTWNDSINNKRMLDTIYAISSPPLKESYCMHTVKSVFCCAYGYGPGYGSGSGKVYSSDFVEGEAYTYGFFNQASQSHNIPTPYIYAAGPPANVKAIVVGISSTSHHLLIDVGAIDVTYFGQAVKKFDFTVPVTDLSDPTTTITFSATNFAATADRNGVSEIEIIYPRQFDFGNNSTFHFTIEGDPGTKKYLEISNPY